jgi:FixJ family two-component response regulator
VRESLELLIRRAEWQLETFESARDFLSHPRGAAPCCLVLDVTLPGLQHQAVQRGRAAGRHPAEPRYAWRCRGSAAAYTLLTPRDREVMPLVVSGLLNKQVGGELGINEITVKVPRAN